MARGIDTKPYLEWLDGEESVAVSPNPPHAIVATELLRLIGDPGRDFGEALPKLHVRLNGEPGKRTVLLPDVAFYRFETLLALDKADRMLPNVPPDIIVEVRSPNDRPGFREEKIQRYLGWGCPVVLDVDPIRRTIGVHDVEKTIALTEHDRFEHPALPWLAFDVRKAFERLDLFGF